MTFLICHPRESGDPGLNPAFKVKFKDWFPAFVGMTSLLLLGAAPIKPLGVQSLDVYAEGEKIHFLTVDYQPGGDAPAIMYFSSDDGGLSYSEPARMDVGLKPIAYANRGNDVPLAATTDQVMAMWPTSGTGYMGSGPIVTSLFLGRRRTAIPAATPADDGTTTGHRFLDLAADKDGTFHAVWLDNRSGKQALYYAQSKKVTASIMRDIEWSKNVVIDEATCECCWNKIAIAPDGTLFVLYRDKDPRDMALAISRDNGATWKRRTGIGRFNWKIDGCPHVGGGLALEPGNPAVAHVLVWNGKDGAEGLYYFSSNDLGVTWSDAVRVGGSAAKHGDIAYAGPGSLVATWDAYDGKYFGIWASRSEDGGKTWGGPKRLSQPNRNSTHPRVVYSQSKFRVFWTERSEKGASALASERMD